MHEQILQLLNALSARMIFKIAFDAILVQFVLSAPIRSIYTTFIALKEKNALNVKNLLN